MDTIDSCPLCSDLLTPAPGTTTELRCVRGCGTFPKKQRKSGTHALNGKPPMTLAGYDPKRASGAGK